MSTIQLIGLAVAIVVLIVLIVTLVVTRGRGEAEAVEPPSPSAETQPKPVVQPVSVFGEAPRDGLAGLGTPVETTSPAWGAAAPGTAGAAMAGAAASGAQVEAAGEAPAQGGQPDVGAAVSGTTPESQAVASAAGVPAIGPDSAWPGPAPVVEKPDVEEAPLAGEQAVSPVEQAVSPLEAPLAGEEGVSPVEEAATPVEGVALSEIIVTTNQQQIDLEDPEVRRLLKDLVEYEIELAQQYKEQGQNVDAVLQLTEAERACNALGLTSKARLIRAMIKELKD